jgi:exodeoxyribonuclease VII small subunit
VSDLGFEAALARLEEILGRLDRGDVTLDEALDLWREGEALHRRCAELLAAAEGRVEELTADGADDIRGDNR